MRVGVYCDMAFRSDGAGVSCGRAFVRFLAALPPRVDELVIFGRLDPAPGRDAYDVPNGPVRFVALPWYPRTHALGAQPRAVGRTTEIFSAELERLDAVVVFGPHPMAMALALTARARSTPVVLGVRQDYPRYIRRRLPGRAWSWAPIAASALDLGFRGLARRAPTVALGDELARRYAGGAPVLPAAFSLVAREQVVPVAAAQAKDWNGTRRVLSVGRLDAEKNPLLLIDVIAQLRARDPRWRLTVAGDGPLRSELVEAAAARGLEHAVEAPGEVANGPELWELYRRSHVFLHVSLTEGLPQVLFEAFAAGLPVVATSVGGVPAALGGGRRGLLVPPGDTAAPVAALERLAQDPGLRRRLISAGHAYALDQTLESQLDRFAAFVSAAAIGPSAPAPAAPASASSSQK
jgi:glycosyltransferase involved in cell wall biosynthesis